MSDSHEPARFGRPRPDDQSIGPLVRLAGPREAVPAERMRRVKAAVHAEWHHERRVRSRRTAMRWSIGALAAAALVLAAVRLRDREAPGEGPGSRVLATVEALNGVVQLASSPGRPGIGPRAARIGDSLRVGDGVETTPGSRVALRLAGGASVRLDRDTRFRLVADQAMVLDAGAVYVEADSGRGGSPLEIRTAFGVVRDIGTRFEVRLQGPAIRVRVRDGLVRLVQPRGTHDVGRGDELTLESSGRVVRRTMPVDGPEWVWVRDMDQTFDIEGRSLREFLEWVAREHSWQLRFADRAVEEKARTTTLHGSIAGLTLEEALAAVLPTSGVEHRVDQNVLVIQLSAGGTKD